jgi:hypothetical protein
MYADQVEMYDILWREGWQSVWDDDCEDSDGKQEINSGQEGDDGQNKSHDEAKDNGEESDDHN